MKTFAEQHDELPAFHATYLVLTFLAAAMLNLGFFAILIVLHAGLDVLKYRQAHKCTIFQTAEGVLRENVLDVTLLLFGFVVSVYLHPTLTGLAGIKGLMLAEMTIIRSIGIITPKLSILYDFIHVASHIEEYIKRVHPHIGRPLTLLEVVCLFSMCVSLAMLLAAPTLLSLTSEQFMHMIFTEGIPWRL